MKINKISSEKEILSDFYKIAVGPRRAPPNPNLTPGIEAIPPASSAVPIPEAPKPKSEKPKAPVAQKAPDESGSAQVPTPNASGILDTQISNVIQNALRHSVYNDYPLNEMLRANMLAMELRNYGDDIIKFVNAIKLIFPNAHLLERIMNLGTENEVEIIRVLIKNLNTNEPNIDPGDFDPFQEISLPPENLKRLQTLYSNLLSDVQGYNAKNKIKFQDILYHIYDFDNLNENKNTFLLTIYDALKKEGILTRSWEIFNDLIYDDAIGKLEIDDVMLDFKNGTKNTETKFLEEFKKSMKEFLDNNANKTSVPTVSPGASNVLLNAPSAQNIAPPKPIDLPSTSNGFGMPDDLTEAAKNVIQSANPERAIDNVAEQAADPQAAKAAADDGFKVVQEVAQKTQTAKETAGKTAAAINTATASGDAVQLDNAVDAAASVAADASAQAAGMQAMLTNINQERVAHSVLQLPTVSLPPPGTPGRFERNPPTPTLSQVNSGVSSTGKVPTLSVPSASPAPASQAKPASSAAAPQAPAPTPPTAAPLPAAPVAAPATPVAAPATPVSSALPQAAQANPPASTVPAPTPPVAAANQTTVPPGSTQAQIPPAAAQAVATATAAQTAAATTAAQAQAATAKVSRLKKLYDTTKDFAKKSAIAKAIGSATVSAATLAAKTAVFLGICYGAYSLHNYLLKDESDAIGEDFLSGASTQFGDLSDNSSLLGGASLDPLNLDEKIGGRADRAIQKAKSLIESGQEAAADVLLNRVAKVYDASGYHKLSPEVSAALSSWTSSDIKYVFPRKSLGARSPLDRARALATEKKILDILTNSNKTNDAVKGRIINDSGTSDGQQIANYMFSTVANKGLFAGGIGGNRRARRWSKGKELDSRENLGFSGSRERKLTRQERKEQRAMGKSDRIDSAEDPFSIFSAAEKEFLEKNSSNINKSTNFNNINKKADKISDGYFKDAIKDLDNDAQIKEYYIAYSELYDAKVEKKPQTFKDLYKVPSKDLTNKAHPKSIVLSDAKGNGGLIENGDEAQKAIIDVVTRNPTGFNNHRYAFIRNALKKI